MKRKAIIIGNNIGYKAPKILKGVDYDLINYYKYLISDIGGEWYGDKYKYPEIEILHNKGKNDIIAAIRNCDADFSFVVFTGHGFIHSKDNLTYICVSDGFLSENDLDTLVEKQTLILDCCREIESLNEGTEAFSELVKSDSLRLFSSERTIINAREKFNNGLSASDDGCFTGYACLIDQTSSDNPTSGGIFSSALLKTGKDFGSRDRDHSQLTIRNAAQRTINTLNRNPFTDQVPTYLMNPSSMKLTHPFAITNISRRL